jgi:hypothetical protein
MTNNNHSITPPPELVSQWAKQMLTPDEENLALDFDWFATQAAQWGSDQELEACCEWMTRMGYWGDDGKAIPALRAARRPKPPSLKEQALEAMHRNWNPHNNDDFATIRRALEQLPDHEYSLPLITHDTTTSHHPTA